MCPWSLSIRTASAGPSCAADQHLQLLLHSLPSHENKGLPFPPLPPESVALLPALGSVTALMIYTSLAAGRSLLNFQGWLCSRPPAILV